MCTYYIHTRTSIVMRHACQRAILSPVRDSLLSNKTATLAEGQVAKGVKKQKTRHKKKKKRAERNRSNNNKRSVLCRSSRLLFYWQVLNLMDDRQAFVARINYFACGNVNKEVEKQLLERKIISRQRVNSFSVDKKRLLHLSV